MAQKGGEVLLEVRSFNLSLGGMHAPRGISKKVRGNQVFSIIGPNGADTTSLLHCISGHYQPQRGSICFRSKDITRNKPNKRSEAGTGRAFQHLALYNHMSVLDNILVGQRQRRIGE